MLGFLYRKYIYYTFNTIPEVVNGEKYQRWGAHDPFEEFNNVVVNEVKDGYVQYYFTDSFPSPFRSLYSMPVKDFVSLYKVK